MKAYFKYFAIPFCIVGFMAIVTCVMFFVHRAETASANSFKSNNNERTTTERVFDNANLLTDAEEAELEGLIAKKEKETGCDIVIVTINESLEEYAKEYEYAYGYLSPDEYVMVYADNFYDEHGFGYEYKGGSGTLFLDNRAEESDGLQYVWMMTSGRALEEYSSSEVDDVLDVVFVNIDEDPYQAYVDFVNKFARDMDGGVAVANDRTFLLGVLGVSLVVAIIYMICNWSGKKGKKTTVSTTYVEGGRPVFKRREDTFLYKNVTKRRIETSSSRSGGGGGGAHRSAGGGMRGGGGRGR